MTDDVLRHITNPRFRAWVQEVERLRWDALRGFLDEETASRVLMTLAEVDTRTPPRPKIGRGIADMDGMIELVRAYLLAPIDQKEAAVGKAAGVRQEKDVKAAVRRVERFLKASGMVTVKGRRARGDQSDIL